MPLNAAVIGVTCDREPGLIGGSALVIAAYARVGGA